MLLEQGLKYQIQQHKCCVLVLNVVSWRLAKNVNVHIKFIKCLKLNVHIKLIKCLKLNVHIKFIKRLKLQTIYSQGKKKGVEGTVFFLRNQRMKWRQIYANTISIFLTPALWELQIEEKTSSSCNISIQESVKCAFMKLCVSVKQT